MAKNWWFKFEYRVWQSDPDLSGCSLAARGLWLEMLCYLYAQDQHTLTASYEKLGRMARCDSSEVAKLILELKHNNVADVTLGHGDVTVMSRRLEKLLKARNQATLRKRKERVTTMSQDRVKSKSKKEEIREQSATPPPPAPDRKNHPAIIAIHEATGIYPPKQIWDDLIDSLGTDIDLVKLKTCVRKWIARGYNKTNYEGIVDWYLNGIPVFKEKTNGNGGQRQVRLETLPTTAQKLADDAAHRAAIKAPPKTAVTGGI